MATKGLRRTYLATVDNKGVLIPNKALGPKGIYESSRAEGDYGTKTANITNIGAKGTPAYGDDAPQYTLKGVSFPEVALEYLNMPLETKMALLGYVNDGKGGYSATAEDTNVALIVETRGLQTGSSLYYAFQNGELIETGKNIATNQATETAADDVFTYSSLKPFSDDWDNGMKLFDGADKNFNKEDMLAEVFGIAKSDALKTNNN